MEGKNKMVIRFLFLCFLFSMIFQGCSPVRVSEKEMIGTWVASDSATLSLNKDGAFVLVGYNSSFFDIESRLKSPFLKVCGKGNWKIGVKNGESFLELHFSKIRNRILQYYNRDLGKFEHAGLEFLMDIVGSNFPFYNKPPWIIQVYEYGVDGGEVYEFYKKENQLTIGKKKQ